MLPPYHHYGGGGALPHHNAWQESWHPIGCLVGVEASC